MANMDEKEKKEKKDEELADEEDAPYPYYVFFILGNEFCERYAYYGMRSILVIFLVRIYDRHYGQQTRLILKVVQKIVMNPLSTTSSKISFQELFHRHMKIDDSRPDLFIASRVKTIITVQKCKNPKHL